MTLLLQQVLSGIATGFIYGSLALALAVIFQGTGVLNFAQGELAVFTTYLSWQMVDSGLNYWLAFGITVVAAFMLGVLIERVLIRPVEGRSVISIVIVTLALLLGINAITGLIWGFVGKEVSNPFGTGLVQIRGAFLTSQQIGVAACIAVTLLVVGIFYRATPVGLKVRAAAINPASARLVGINVGWMLAIGWGIAASVGAVAGMASAPISGLSPDVMSGTLLLAFAAYILGGQGSRLGAVIGGVIIGILVNISVTYVDFISGDLANLVPFMAILIVLLVRPQGLLGSKSAVRA